MRAHSTRAAAASLGDLMGVSVEDLCTTASWSSHLVFAKLYRLDYAASRGIASQVLAAALAILQGWRCHNVLAQIHPCSVLNCWATHGIVRRYCPDTLVCRKFYSCLLCPHFYSARMWVAHAGLRASAQEMGYWIRSFTLAQREPLGFSMERFPHGP